MTCQAEVLDHTGVQSVDRGECERRGVIAEGGVRQRATELGTRLEQQRAPETRLMRIIEMGSCHECFDILSGAGCYHRKKACRT